jgi:TonB-linked SusC/RagA family outer membrane protein
MKNKQTISDSFCRLEKLTKGSILVFFSVTCMAVGSFASPSVRESSVPAAQQTRRTVTGTVTDSKGEPIIGANIMEKGASNGSVSDLDGKFSLSVPGDAVLQVSYIGYLTQEIAVGNQTSLKITLREDTQALEEVVVVGYGTQKKVNLSGSVSSVSAKALENRPVTNANLAFQGLAPGMNIQMENGYAAQASDINIRGFTSINGGSAFILVDNVPVTASELSRINPADIENVSVLKDAASAAIYGARAAFGVVLITTKTAKDSKLTIDADLNVGFRSFFNIPQMSTNIYEFMKAQSIFAEDPGRYTEEQYEYAKKRMADPSLPALLYPENALKPSNKANGYWEYYYMTNWFDLMCRDNSPVQTYNIRVSQKGEQFAFNVSGALFKQDGMMNFINDVLTRYNVRANGTYKFTKWWEVGTNLSFMHRTFDRPTYAETAGGVNNGSETTSGNHGWDFYRIYQSYPTDVIYNPDGSATDSGSRMIDLIEGGNTITQLNEIQASFNTTIDILKDAWNVKADATYRFTDEFSNMTFLGDHYRTRGPGLALPVGPARNTVTKMFNKYIVYNVYTDFHKTFAEKHYLQAMTGFNQEYYISDFTSLGANNLLTNSLPTVALTGPESTVSYGQTINTLALRGVFGRLNYIFDNRYIVEFNGRYDGTSRYPKESRFGFFPSFSAGWVLSNEKFMEGIKNNLQISNIKLRGSYGTLGNQVNDSYYPYLPLMGYTAPSSPIIDGGLPIAITQPSVVSGDLTWETVRTVNGGIDLGLFDNRFDLSFDKYTRYTEGMLTRSKSLPAIFGATEPQTNAANLKTKGWDLSVGWRDRIDAVAGSPLNYSVRLMLHDNRAWITKFDNPSKNLDDHYEGQELGEIWGYTTVGYFKSEEDVALWADQSAVGNGRGFYAGDLKFADLNDDGKIDQGSNTVDDPGDRKIIGNNSYRFPFSVDLNGDWKGFDLRLFVQGVGKRTAYPPGGHNGIFFWGQYATPWVGFAESVLDNWDYKGDDGYFPRMKAEIAMSGELAKVQTKYLQNAAYARLKNITIGYTLPRQWTNRWRLEKLRLYASGENLYTLHFIDIPGSDPERFDNAYYPFTRVFTFGLNLTF